MKHTKILAGILAAALIFGGTLTGCGKQESAASKNTDVNAATAQTTAAAATTASATETKELKVLKIGASPSPHAEILKSIIPALKEKGIDLQIVEFTDYVQPNLALQNKELDANYFQHVPYLNDFNAKNNTQISSAAAIHFEPLGIYPGKTKTLADVKEGDTIAVPNDTSNEARALLLLESAGLIKIKEGAGLNATVKDIAENPKKLNFKELEAAQIARSLPDVNLAVINGNYAIEANLNAAKDALKAEDKESLAAKTFANIIAVRTGDENRADIKTLIDVLTSQQVKDFINDKYQGAVIPVF